MSQLDIELKNPWQVSHFDEFLYYCCPECIYRSQNFDNFEEHARNIHMIDIHNEQFKEKPNLLNVKKEKDVEIKQEYFEDEIQNGSIVENSEDTKSSYIIQQIHYEDTKPLPKNTPDFNTNKTPEPEYNKGSKVKAYTLLQCTLCEKKYTQSHNLKHHIGNVHEGKMPKEYDDPDKDIEKKFPCDKCNKSFTQKNSLNHHIRTFHEGQKSFKCETCGKSFTKASHVRIHIKTVHEGAKDFKCEPCGKYFSQSSHYNKHRRIVHKEVISKPPPKEIKCDFCGKSFSANYLLKIHISGTHETSRDHLCDICSKAFRSKAYLKLHMKLHTNEKEFQCDICSKAYVLERDLKTHIERHGEKCFKCDLCDSSFSYETGLKMHKQKVHEKLYDSKCEICGKTFNRYALKRHIAAVHTGERPFKCLECQRSFITDYELGVHVKVAHSENGGRLHKCKECPSSFEWPHELKNHINNVHEGKKDHQCTLCGRAFGTKPTLITHIKRHTKDFKYQCETCGKKFIEPKFLRDHVKFIHLGLKDYKCDLCDAAYGDGNVLRRHKKRVHGVYAKLKSGRKPKESISI